MHLGKEENIKGKKPGDDGRNKYFVVLGHDLDGNAIGVVIIDTEINPNLPPRRQQMHYQLSAKVPFFICPANNRQSQIVLSDILQIREMMAAINILLSWDMTWMEMP